MKTAGIKEGLVIAFAPPPIFGLGNAGGSSSISRTAAKAARSGWPK